MKYLILLGAICTMTIFNVSTAQAKKRLVPKMYMFGFSASFNDSTVYFTDIQQVDSAWVDEKTNFLQGRDIYGQQLKDYLTASMQPNRVCFVIYAEKRKDIEKEYVKMKRLYTKKRKNAAPYDIRYLDETMFRFQQIYLYFEDDK